MKIKELYKYERAPGKITVSTNKPNVDYTIIYRIIADDGYLVTQDGVNLFGVVDTTDNQNWYEVEAQTEEV